MKFERFRKWEKRPRCSVILREWNDPVHVFRKQCRDDAICTVDGEPHCRRHAQEKALAFMLREEEEVS